MPNARLTNTVVRAGIKTTAPSSRVSSFQTGRAGEPRTQVYAGTPIGLLLALTYANDFIPDLESFSDFRPNANIKNSI